MLGVRGLREFWEGGPLGTPQRVMLDALGLGLEQTMQFVRIEAPDFDAFQRWILETAGEPDPLAIERYHNMLDGLPPPDAVRAQLDAIDAMPPVLDAGDLEHWDREGYVILRNAITPEEAAASADLLWQTVKATPDDPESWYRERINGIMVQRFQGEAMEAPRRSARLHKAFAQLWGTADLWHLIDRLGFNPPLREGYNFRATDIHWDISIAPPIPFATQGILYLTDTAANQGALQLVPGFHRKLADGWLDSIGDADPRQHDFSSEAVPIAANAGDLIIWRADIPHAASRNRAALPRLVHYVTMYSDKLRHNPVWI